MKNVYRIGIFVNTLNYNLGFGRPVVDACVKCEELSTKIKSPVLHENAKKVAVAELLVHKRKAKKFTLL